MPGFRFTIRRMMAAVAIMGVMIAFAAGAYRSYEGKRRSAYFQGLADFHTAKGLAAFSERYGPDSAGHYRHFLVTTPVSKFHRAMREKYERAARDPWLPVAPDPPDPQ